MSKNALGKGLESLFQTPVSNKDSVFTGEKQETKSGGFGYNVEIRKIYPNPEQPRKDFDETALQELSDSIKEKGILQPILVQKKGDKYIIVAGERRYRAAILAGLKEVPVIEKTFQNGEELEVALIENIQRENLSPIEEARAYSVLISNYNLGQDDLSKKVGKNRSTIANSLRLLKMPNDMQDALSSGAITPGHARAILSVVNPSDQRILFSRIVNSGLSVREAEQHAGELNKGIRSVSKDDKKDELKKKKSPDIMGIEQQFIDRLGTKVNLIGSMNKGKIEISYFSRDDLERLYELIIK